MLLLHLRRIRHFGHTALFGQVCCLALFHLCQLVFRIVRGDVQPSDAHLYVFIVDFDADKFSPGFHGYGARREASGEGI